MTKLRRLISKKNKKGISLIEVLVSLTLTVLLVTALTSMLTPITKGYAKAEDTSILASVGSLLIEDVVARAMGCKDLFVYNSSNGIATSNLEGRIQVRMYDKKLQAKGAAYESWLLPSEKSYNGCEVTAFKIKCSPSPVMENKIRVMSFTIMLKRNATEYTVERTATIMNLEYYEKDYVMDNSTSGITSHSSYSSEIYIYSTTNKFTNTSSAATTGVPYKSFIYMPQGVLV